MLESIYYVISWACLRACAHCYDDRFRPYGPDQVKAQIVRATEDFPCIVDNFPETMEYVDLEHQHPDGSFARKTGRIILSGGEVLLEPVRTGILYPILEKINERYRKGSGCKVVVQTSGDLLNPDIVSELLERNVWMISVSSMDDFHVRSGKESNEEFRDRLTGMFEAAGMQLSGLESTQRKWTDEAGPVFSFFGASPEAWIGKLWPSGRAWKNGLSTAQFKDNFCNNWSGGLNFLNIGFSGSEVAVDPHGDLYPCCRKTRLPYGNLTEEPMLQILQSLVGQPEFESLSMGHPERMGQNFGIDLAEFVKLSRGKNAKGAVYANRCIGCDRVHEQFLAPILSRLKKRRRRKGNC